MFTHQELHAQGYCIVKSMYSGEVLNQLNLEAETLIQRCYNQAELDRHSVYPSDAGDARISHAFMLAEGNSDLPTVRHDDLPTVNRFLHDYHCMLGELTEVPVSTSARSMLNYQNYFTGSKPVGEHFDGEYLRTTRAADGIEFSLEEGILPRYVAILIIANENHGKGIELVDNQTRQVYQPVLDGGDLAIFDNIRLRHRVPKMEKPRTTIGLRNFDHKPFHFVRSRDDCLEGHYQPIAEGWVSEDADCRDRLQRFFDHEWPKMKQEYSHYF